MRRRLLFFAALPVAALGVLSVPLFVTYDDDRVGRADAVVVLSGSRYRLPRALELMARGVAPVLVVSDGHRLRPVGQRTVCSSPLPYEVLCPLPDPYSTRGEAQLVARLAQERGWRSLVVVTSRFHLFRTRLLFERCFDGELALVGARYTWWRVPLAIGFEWLKLVNAGIHRGC